MGPRFEVSVYGRGTNPIDYMWDIVWSGQDFMEAVSFMADLKKQNSATVVRLIWRGE